MSYYISINKARLTKKHYENFPVATLIFPKKERYAATILYQFARECDDIADEGNLNKAERYAKLKIYQNNIENLHNENYRHSNLFDDLKLIHKNFKLDINLFHRLFKAFYQDISNQTYQKFDDVIDYCFLAACPAGEMILSLFKQNKKDLINHSNNLCISLALIGMLQDIKEDYEKNRFYIPREDFRKFKLKKDDIKNNNFNYNWDKFKNEWLARIQNYLNSGKKLQNQTQGRLRLQIKILIMAVELLIRRLKKNTNLFKSTSKITKIDWLLIFFKALLKP